MNLKKVLTGALIGAFVFGISAGSLQTANATSLSDFKKAADAKKKIDEAQRTVGEVREQGEQVRDRVTDSGNANGRRNIAEDKAEQVAPETVRETREKAQKAKKKIDQAKKVADRATR